MKSKKKRLFTLLLVSMMILNAVSASAETLLGKILPDQKNETNIVQNTESRAEEKEVDEESGTDEYALSEIIEEDSSVEEANYEASNDFIPGDLNGDAKVNISDVVLFRQYLAGSYNVSINENAADVNADGTCNAEDLILLRKYIAGGYDVELKNSAENTYKITYHVDGGDTYLETLDIENKNPTTYKAGQNIKLTDLSVRGCVFEGWYDGPGNSASLVKEITANETGDKELYARWTFIEYTVQFESEFSEIESKTYTVNKGTTLINPTLSGYVFTGWMDDKNNIVSRIEKGTVGNITLRANWCSKRNMARPVSSLGDPVIYFDEELGCIQFAYAIGKIENVPLYQIEYLGNKADGITYIKTTTTSGTVIKERASVITETVANATTKSSTWTLSKDWNVIKSSSSTTGSETESEISDESENGSENTVESESEHDEGGSESSSAGGSLHMDFKVGTGPECARVETAFGGEGHYDKSDVNTWNDTIGYRETNKTTTNEKHMSKLCSKIIASSTESFSRSDGGSESSSTALETTSTNTRECASSITYSTQEAITSTIQYSNENAPEGWYRVVCAGTLHVYAVVNYDIATRSYGVFTYSLLEDETHDFLDYSRVSGSFDDNMDGVLPFEVPIFVDKYVESVVGSAEKKAFSIDSETGIIDNYFGTDTDIIIPDYMTMDSGNGTTTVVKVTGIGSGAFAEKDIKSIQLCDNITKIPDGAFKNCTVLETVYAPAVTSIGSEGFSGCSSLSTFTISENIVSVGESAFVGVERVNVNAANLDVAQKMIQSGAKNITLTISSISGSLDNAEFEIPKSVDSFTLIGDGSTNMNIRVISDASETIINNVSFIGNAAALKISSSKVTLNRVKIETSALALILSADETELKLFGTIQVKSSGDNAILCKNILLKRLNANVVGKLNVTGNILIYGSVTNDSLLTFSSGELMTISQDEFTSLYNNNWSEWSEWTTTPITSSLNTEVETKIQYQYSDKQTTTSTSSSLAGWTQTGSEIQYGSWGSWSAWGRDYVAGSDTREVNTATVYGYYYFRCPNCGAHMHGYPTCWTWADGCGSSSLTLSCGVGILDPAPHSSVGLYDFHGTGKYATDNLPQYGRVFKWTDENGVGSWIGYQYRDRSKTIIYSYYKWSEWSPWSDTIYTSSSTRNVQTRTLYRSRTRL